LHAAFKLKGQYGELLPHIGGIQRNWLRNSGYFLQTTPTIVQYDKNHFKILMKNSMLPFTCQYR